VAASGDADRFAATAEKLTALGRVRRITAGAATPGTAPGRVAEMPE